MDKNKIGMMQPYVFPYIGYFNLVQASDVFVFCDDVNYIKQGWINRNRILINGATYKFSIPLKNGSPHELIKNVTTSDLNKFSIKFYKQLENAYCKAPYFNEGMKYVEGVLSIDSDSISKVAIKSVIDFFSRVDIEKKFIVTSDTFSNLEDCDKEDRILRVVKSLDSSHYINPIGGSSLYVKDSFSEQGVELSFLEPELLEYKQVGKGEFIPALSIIDVIMNISIDEIRNHLNSYKLV